MNSRLPALAALATFLGLQSALADGGTVIYKSVTPEVAIDAVQIALKKCRTDGFQVVAVVVDRFGQTQALMRDQYAGPPAAETATEKAYTALSFRQDTSALAQSVKSGQISTRLSMEPRILMIAGGLVIESGGTLLGAIGVAGAPTGESDESCAKAGLDSVHDKIDF